MDPEQTVGKILRRPDSRFSSTRKKKYSEHMKIVGKYKIGGKIGEGSNGEVHSACQVDGGKIVAVKIVGKTQDNYEKLKNQIKIIQLVKHPNIVQIYDVIEEDEKVYIFMELCQKGDLFNQVRQKKKLDEGTAAQFFIKIYEALVYLHSQGIAHRDVKAENILLDANMIPKLTDFGLAKQYDSNKNSLLETACGSFNYIAPEMIKKKNYKPELVDLWSLGVMLYIMLIGKQPFHRSGDHTVTLQSIISYDWFKDTSLSKEARQLFEKIFIPAQHRIKLFEIRNTSFFKKYQDQHKKHQIFQPQQSLKQKKRWRSNPRETKQSTNQIFHYHEMSSNLDHPIDILNNFRRPSSKIEAIRIFQDQRTLQNISTLQHREFRVRRKSLPRKNLVIA